MYRVGVQATFDALAKATQCGEVIEAEAMAARAADLLPARVGAEWGVQEVGEDVVPAATEEVLAG